MDIRGIAARLAARTANREKLRKDVLLILKSQLGLSEEEFEAMGVEDRKYFADLARKVLKAEKELEQEWYRRKRHPVDDIGEPDRPYSGGGVGA